MVIRICRTTFHGTLCMEASNSQVPFAALPPVRRRRRACSEHSCSGKHNGSILSTGRDLDARRAPKGHHVPQACC